MPEDNGFIDYITVEVLRIPKKPVPSPNHTLTLCRLALIAVGPGKTKQDLIERVKRYSDYDPEHDYLALSPEKDWCFVIPATGRPLPAAPEFRDTDPYRKDP